MRDVAGAIAVVGDDPLREEVAGGLRDLGATVGLVDVDPDFDAGLAAAEATTGPLDGVVWASADPHLGTPKPFARLDEVEWRSLAEDPLHSFVGFLQAARRRLRGRDGRIVVLVPTIAMDGAAGVVAWAAVADGQRALVKSAARVWGADGITLNCVAVPAALMVGPAGGPHLDRPGLQQPALADPSLRAEVAAVVASLCAPAAGGVTGATIAVDGGRWMAP